MGERTARVRPTSHCTAKLRDRKSFFTFCNVTLSYITRLESGSSASGIDLVARLAAALGTTVADLLPATTPPDDLKVLRQQAKRLFDDILQTESRETLSFLNQFLSRLSETGR